VRPSCWSLLARWHLTWASREALNKWIWTSNFRLFCFHRRYSVTSIYPLAGGCDCGQVRYQLESKPLIVHCCHCRWCQRETGASFALNAVIEADRVTLLKGNPEVVNTPSASGQGQMISRCPKCHIAIWSNYSGAGPAAHFVRVGTLDEPDHLPPDIHIFTSSRQPWVVLSPEVPAVSEYYDLNEYWPAESLERRNAAMSRNQS